MKKEDRWHQFLSSAVEQSSEGIGIADLNYKVMYVNPAWANMHGYDSPTELIGKPLKIFHNQKQFGTAVKPFIRIVFDQGHHAGEMEHIRKDGTPFPTMMTTTLLKDDQGKPVAIMGIAQDISARKRSENNKDELIKGLQNAFDEVNLLSGLLPICASCKKIRDDKGYWNKIETYISSHSKVEFSHSICPDCAKKLYPDLYNEIFGKND
jgi:PAS domain S-box-containing protein